MMDGRLRMLWVGECSEDAGQLQFVGVLLIHCDICAKSIPALYSGTSCLPANTTTLHALIGQNTNTYEYKSYLFCLLLGTLRSRNLYGYASGLGYWHVTAQLWWLFNAALLVDQANCTMAWWFAPIPLMSSTKLSCAEYKLHKSLV